MRNPPPWPAVATKASLPRRERPAARVALLATAIAAVLVGPGDACRLFAPNNATVVPGIEPVKAPPAEAPHRTTKRDGQHAGRKGKPSDASAERGIATPQWKLARYRYSTNGAPIADALRSLSAATGVPIDCATGLAGVVVGRFDLPP